MAMPTTWYYLVIRIMPAYRKGENRPPKKQVRFGLFFNAPPGMSEDDMVPLLRDNEEFFQMYMQYNPDNNEAPRILFEKVTEMGHGSTLHCVGLVEAS